MELKICSKCKLGKNLNEFSRNKNKKDGLSMYCKSCNKTYQQNHYLNNKDSYSTTKAKQKTLIKEHISKVKGNSKCSHCPETDIACLDFHHIDETEKGFEISDAVNKGVSINTLEKEIDKCKILCSNCHRKLHYYGELI